MVEIHWPIQSSVAIECVILVRSAIFKLDLGLLFLVILVPLRFNENLGLYPLLMLLAFHLWTRICLLDCRVNHSGTFELFQMNKK